MDRLEVHHCNGSCLNGASRLTQTAQVLRVACDRSRLVITASASTSAASLLDRAADAAASQHPEEAAKAVRSLRTEYGACASVFNTVPNDTESLFCELTDLLTGAALIGELTPRVRDRVMSCGPKLAARLLAAALRTAGVEAFSFDTDDTDAFLETDATFGAAQPIETLADRTVATLLGPSMASNRAVVTPAGCGVGPDGATTMLGQGGDDLTATLLARALRADEAVFWTTSGGLYTADPSQVPTARVIPRLHYRESAALARGGHGALHQRAQSPAHASGIPLRIACIDAPLAGGTRIDGRLLHDISHVKAVQTIPGHCLFSLLGRGFSGKRGISARLLDAVSRAGVSVTMISQAGSETSITIAVPHADADAVDRAVRSAFAEEIASGDVEELATRPRIGLLAAVGAGVGADPRTLGRLFTAVADAGVNVAAVALGDSERNTTLAIDEHDLPAAARAVHDAFNLGSPVSEDPTDTATAREDA